jgi:hypothetical protein
MPTIRENGEAPGTPLFEWALTGSGWATATMRLGDGQPLEMTASYLHDSLRDLAGALIALDEGSKEVQAVLMAKPGEHHVVMRRAGEAELEIEVRWFADWASWNMHSLDDYETVARGVVRWRKFRGCVVSCMRRLLGELGPEGYRKKWVEHDFPVQELARLEGR